VSKTVGSVAKQFNGMLQDVLPTQTEGEKVFLNVIYNNAHLKSQFVPSVTIRGSFPRGKFRLAYIVKGEE
jgi:hypothetical protein